MPSHIARHEVPHENHQVRELQTGLWHWEAPHPEWAPSEPWDQVVSSYAIDDGDRLLLFDPLAVPNELEERAAEREAAIVLTNPWHERGTQSLVERLGVPVFTPLPDSAEDLMQKYASRPTRLGMAVRTWSGCSGRTRARHAPTRPATECHSEQRCFPDGSRTTPCSGSKVTVRSSPATRSSTSAKASRSRCSGYARA